MKRRLKRLLLLSAILASLAASILVGVQSPPFERWTQARILSSLESRFNAKFEVGSLDLDPLRLSARVSSFQVKEDSPTRADVPPLLQAGRIRIELAPSILLGRIHVEELEIEQPVVRLRKDDSDGLNLTRAFASRRPRKQSADGTARFRIGAVSITRGRVFYNDRALPELSARMEFKGGLESGPQGGGFDGTLEIAHLQIHTSPVHLNDARLALRFSGLGNPLSKLSMSLRSPALTADLEGEADISGEDPAFRFTTRLEGDLGQLRGPGLAEDLDAGGFRLEGEMNGSRSGFTFKGRLKAEKLAKGPVLLTELDAPFEADSKHLRIEAFTARLRGGDLSLAGSIGYGETNSSRLRLEATQVDLEGLHPALSGRTGVEADLSWPGLDWRQAKGKGSAAFKGTFALTRPNASPIPLPVEGKATLETRDQRLSLQGLLTAPDTQIEFRAGLGPNLDYQAQLEARSKSGQPFIQAAIDAAGNRFPAEVAAGLSMPGSIDFALSVSGSDKNAARLSGRVDKADLHWQGRPLGALQSEFVLADGRLEAQRLDLVGEDIQLNSTLSLPLDRLGAALFDLQLQLKGACLSRFRSLLGPIPETDGCFSGRLQADRDDSGRLRVGGRIQSRKARLYGQPIDELDTEVRLDATKLDLSQLRVRMGQGLITGRVSADLALRTFRTSLQGSRLPLDRIESIRSRSELSGPASFNLQAEGPWAAPRFKLDLSSQGLRMEGFEIEAILLKAEGDSKGATFTLEHRMLGSLLRTQGTVGLHPSIPVDAEVTLEHAELGPFLPLLDREGRLPKGTNAWISGSLKVAGPLNDPASITARAHLKGFHLSADGYELHSAEGEEVKAELSAGRLRLEALNLVGDESELRVSGEADINKETLVLEVKGRSDLRLLNLGADQRLLPEGLQIAGLLELDMTVSGNWSDPSIAGSAFLTEGQLQGPGIPSLTDASGSFKFVPSQISIDRFRARTEFGEIESTGGIFLRGWTPQLWKINLFGRGLQFDEPEDLHSVADVNLEFVKRGAAQRIGGQVRLRSAEYSRNLTLTELITRVRRQSAPVSAQRPGEAIDLDIRIDGYRSLRVINGLADIRASVAVNLRGTVGNPILLGSVNVDEGQIFFNDNEFNVSRGALTFTDPRRTAAVMNFAADATVRDFAVTVEASGPLDGRQTVRFSSDPPLPQADILALLAMGQTLNEMAGGNASASATRVGALSASKVLSQALEDTLQERTNRLFGLQRFSVDPFLAGGGRDPGARITLGRRLGKNLSLTYITDVGSEDPGQIVVVEVKVTDGVSAVATREPDGSFAIDFKLRKRF